MNHRITIKNLGPIKDITDFEVRRINAVIGESTTGKSLLAKAIFCFNDSDFLAYMMDKQEVVKEQLASNIKWAFTPYSDFSIVYHYTDDYYISINSNSDIEFSSKLSARIKEVNEKMGELEQDAQVRRYQETLVRAAQQGLEAERVRDLLKQMPEQVKAGAVIRGQFVSELGVKATVFIPDNRSSVDYFDRMRLGRRSNVSTDDMMLTVFSDHYNQYLRSFKILDHPLMRGKVYKIHDQMLRFTPDNSHQVLDISETSSGQRAMFSILMILQGIVEQQGRALIIIEEPEENIYPEDQKKLLDHIIEVANATGSSVFITTHSPYVLMAMNNLMEAKSRGYPKLKDRYIDIKETNVARLENGECENIVDPEDELIDVGPIQFVDNLIVGEFEDILSYEPK